MADCPSCGGSYGSRYHEVAHAPDVETASVEDLEAAAAIYDRVVNEKRSANRHVLGNAQCERCEAFALPAFSTERLCEDCKEAVRPALRALLDQYEKSDAK